MGYGRKNKKIPARVSRCCAERLTEFRTGCFIRHHVPDHQKIIDVFSVCVKKIRALMASAVGLLPRLVMAGLVPAIHAAPPQQRGRPRLSRRRRPMTKNNGFGLAASLAPFRRVECVDGRADPRNKSGDGHDAFRAAATANAVRAETRRHIPACVPRAEARSIRLAWATTRASAAGVTPSIRRAWPRLKGRTAMNFCFISLERPARAA